MPISSGQHKFLSIFPRMDNLQVQSCGRGLDSHSAGFPMGWLLNVQRRTFRYIQPFRTRETRAARKLPEAGEGQLRARRASRRPQPLPGDSLRAAVGGGDTGRARYSANPRRQTTSGELPGLPGISGEDPPSRRPSGPSPSSPDSLTPPPELRDCSQIPRMCGIASWDQ